MNDCSSSKTHPAFLPVLAAVVSVVLFSTGGLSIKHLTLTALPLAGLRALVAALFFACYLYRREGSSNFFQLNRYGWIAAVSYLLMTVTYVLSMKLTTAANAIFLQYTMPAWVLVGGALWLKESVTPGRLAAISLSMAGMGLFFLGDLQPRDWQGNIAALTSGLAFAILVLALRKGRDSRPLHAVFWGNALTAIVVLPIALALQPDCFAPMKTFGAWSVLLWLGLFQIGVAYLFYVFALKHIPAFEVALISLIEPILNPTWVFLAKGEQPSYWAYWGGALIVVSVLFRTFSRGDIQSDEQPDAR